MIKMKGPFEVTTSGNKTRAFDSHYEATVLDGHLSCGVFLPNYNGATFESRVVFAAGSWASIERILDATPNKDAA